MTQLTHLEESSAPLALVRSIATVRVLHLQKSVHTVVQSSRGYRVPWASFCLQEQQRLEPLCCAVRDNPATRPGAATEIMSRDGQASELCGALSPEGECSFVCLPVEAGIAWGILFYLRVSQPTARTLEALFDVTRHPHCPPRGQQNLHREGRIPELGPVCALHLHPVRAHPQIVPQARHMLAEVAGIRAVCVPGDQSLYRLRANSNFMQASVVRTLEMGPIEIKSENRSSARICSNISITACSRGHTARTCSYRFNTRSRSNSAGWCGVCMSLWQTFPRCDGQNIVSYGCM